MIELLENRALLSSYYIDPAGNDDLNDGLTPQTPWATFKNVNSAPFAAGDEILLSAGKPFAGTLRFGPDDVGTADAPIRVGIYGGGTDPTPAGRATIYAGNNPGILVVNTAGIEISDLNVIGLMNAAGSGSAQTPASYSGIEFRNTMPGDVKLGHVRINRVDVSGFGDYGIEVTGTAGKSGFRDVSIDHVDVHHNTHGGISSTGLWDNTSTTYAHENVIVRHASVWRNTGWAGSPNHSGSGIVLADARDVTVERSVASYNGENNTHVGGPVGIWVWDVDGARIRHNESHHNLTNSTADGGGFDFDGGVTNSVMEYNYSHHNAGAGYGIYQFAGARPFYNNHVRYNISVDDGRKNSYGAIDFWNGNGGNGIRDTYVYNNTVYVSPSTEQREVTTTRKGMTSTAITTVKVGDPRALRFISGTVNVSVFNNIFQTTGGVLLAQIDAKQTNLRMNGNNWHSSNGPFALKVFAKTYTSFSAYVRGTGHDRQGMNADPVLVAPLSKPTVGISNIDDLGDMTSDVLSGYRLSSSSTLKNKGLPATWPYGAIPAAATDFYGNPLPRDGSDIGAHEYAVA